MLLFQFCYFFDDFVATIKIPLPLLSLNKFSILVLNQMNGNIIMPIPGKDFLSPIEKSSLKNHVTGENVYLEYITLKPTFSISLSIFSKWNPSLT